MAMVNNILEITNDEWIDILDNLDSRSYYFEYKDETYKVEENIEEGTTVLGYPSSVVKNISTDKYFAIQEKYNKSIDTYELYNVLEVYPEIVTITVYNTKRN